MFNLWKMPQLIDRLALAVKEMREEESVLLQSQGLEVGDFTHGHRAAEENTLGFLHELINQEERQRETTTFNYIILCQTQWATFINILFKHQNNPVSYTLLSFPFGQECESLVVRLFAQHHPGRKWEPGSHSQVFVCTARRPSYQQTLPNAGRGCMTRSTRSVTFHVLLHFIF